MGNIENQIPENSGAKQRVLVLGGTQMIGRDFVEKIKDNSDYKIYISNRGITNPNLFKNNNDIELIKIDRNEPKSCSDLSGIFFDIVIDFSCYTTQQYINTINYLNYNKYILISTQSVLDSNTLNKQNHKDPYYWYCLHKKELEEYVIANSKNTIIVRPGAVYGHNDYTGRFEHRGGEFYWKNTNTKASETKGCISCKTLIDYLINNVMQTNIENQYNCQILQIP